MLLALDVGNTSITLGLFHGRRLVRKGRISTHKTDYEKELARWIKPFVLSLSKDERSFRASTGSARTDNSVEAVILSSVVPAAVPSLIRAVRSAGLPRPRVVGKDLKAPILNRTRVPSQVGQDRLVNAVAALELYGGPAIVVDFGTAITIDLVSARREYRGGLIVPGMEIALEALERRAALLPHVPFARPKELLGRDTRSSMQSGLFYGYGALCDGIVTRLKKKYAPRACVIATGGHARLIAPFCKTVHRVNLDLTLQGLELIVRKVLP